MKKGTYIVHETHMESGGVKGGGGGGVKGGGGGVGGAPAPADHSYSACLLALLFFLALCIIIMLAAWPWNQGKKDEVNEEEHVIHDKLTGDEETERPYDHKPTQSTTHGPVHSSSSPPLHHETTPEPDITTEVTQVTHHQPLSPSQEGEYHDYDNHGTETEAPPHKFDYEYVEENTHKKGGVKTGIKRPNNKTHNVKGNKDNHAEWISENTTDPARNQGENRKGKLVVEEDSISTTVPQKTHTQPADQVPHVHDPETTLEPVVLVTTQKPQVIEEVCETPTCKSVSARMLALMDHSIEPCDDFYSFSCGGMAGDGAYWITEDDAESRVRSRLSEMLGVVRDESPESYKKFQSFYDSCVHYDEHTSHDERLSLVLNILKSIGKFYVKSEWDHNPGNLTNLLGILMKHNFAPLFDILLDVDSRDSNKFAVKLTAPVTKSPLGDQNGVALNGWPSESCKYSINVKSGSAVDLNQQYKIYSDCRSAYQDYLDETTFIINTTDIIQLVNDSATIQAVGEIVISLEETLIAKVYNNPSKKKILKSKDFKLYTITDLNKKFPMIEWQALISMLIGDVPESTEIQVYFDKYLISFFAKLVGERELYNSLMAMFAHELYYGLVESRSSCDRKNYCLGVAKELMDPVASALFLKSYPDGELTAFQAQITKMFNELMTSFKAEISTLPWMDPISSNLVLNKLTNLKLHADGGVSIFNNTAFLDKLFEKEAIGKSYLQNVMVLMKRYRERMYHVYKKNPSDPEQIWSHFLLPYDTSGIVIYGLNSIVIPYGMMSKPFFNKHYPTAVQISGLGFMIAHEIWHHFDTAGLRHGLVDHNETLSQAVMLKINNTVDCASKQYNSPLHHKTADGLTLTYKVNPSLSLNERLADTGGAHLGFKTIWGYSSLNSSQILPWSNFTSKQLYFISMAQNFCTKNSAFEETMSIFEDVHLPPLLRVNDIAQNSEEFAEAFSCPDTAKPRCKPFTSLRKPQGARR